MIPKPAVTPLIAKDSSPISDDEGKLRRWAEHFTEVVNCEALVSEAALDILPVISCSNSSNNDCDSHLNAPPSEEEISLANSQLKSGKAPGIDDIPAEFLKLGGVITVQWLSSLFTSIWNNGTVPSDWRKQLNIPLHKKGSRADCDNYRGITLLSIPSKVFTRVILNRLKPKAEASFRENQCGFRRGRGCVDQLFTLRILLEKAREFQQPIYVCFIDLRKAYDSVHREALWRVLQHSYQLPDKLVSIIKIIHEDSIAAVRAYGRTSGEFSVTSGVHQGCVLAPTLFNFYLDAVLHLAIDTFNQEGMGIQVAYHLNTNLIGNHKKMTHETNITDLEYADDMALISSSWDHLITMVESLNHHCFQLGLRISCKKTKILAVNPSLSLPDSVTLRDDDIPIDVVEDFQCLRSTVSDDCTTDSEITHRISRASQSFQALNRLLWYQRKIKISTKLRIFLSVIIPMLLYSLECTVVSQSQVDRLQRFVMKCLRLLIP